MRCFGCWKVIDTVLSMALTNTSFLVLVTKWPGYQRHAYINIYINMSVQGHIHRLMSVAEHKKKSIRTRRWLYDCVCFTYSILRLPIPKKWRYSFSDDVVKKKKSTKWFLRSWSARFFDLSILLCDLVNSGSNYVLKGATARWSLLMKKCHRYESYTREICARICVCNISFVSNYTMSKTNEPSAFIDYLLSGQYL